MTDPPADMTDRLVVALDPTPGTREIVTRRIVEFAAEIGDVEILSEVVDAAEHPEGVGASELADRAGVTYRQVNYWTGEGYLRTAPRPDGRTGSGIRYTYPAGTILKARVMGSLVRLFSMHPERASALADRIVNDGSVEIGGFRVSRDGLS
jgi:hypothetical protein